MVQGKEDGDEVKSKKRKTHKVKVMLCTVHQTELMLDAEDGESDRSLIDRALDGEFVASRLLGKYPFIEPYVVYDLEGE